MPQVKTEPNRKKRKNWLLAVAGAVVAVVLGVVAWYLLLPSPKAVAAQADDLNNHAKYSQAMTVLKAAQWRAWSKNDKILIVSGLATTSANAGDLNGALIYFQQLDKLVPDDYSTALTEGDILLRQGRKTEAIAAYKRALTALKKLPTEGSMETPDSLQAQIEELQK